MPSAHAREWQPRRPSAWLGLLAVACLAAGCASTGELRGRLLVAGEPPRASRAGRGSFADAIVYAVRVPERRTATADRSRPKPIERRVLLTAGGFEPRVVAIPRGSVVRFVNADRVYHKLFSVSGCRHFHLPGCPPGRAQSVVFDTAGVVSLYCELHPDAAGFVLVLRDRFYVCPGRDGRFSLAQLPPGSYVVTAWHPVLGESSRRVEVRAGHPVNLELTF